MAVDSIWNNEFYNRAPVPTWMFEIDFTQIFADNSDKQDRYAKKVLNKAVISCAWNERSINTIPIYYAGVEGKVPGRVANSGELEIKFNENASFQVTKILEELFHADASCDSYFDDKGPYSFNRRFNKNRIIRLILHSPENNKIFIQDPKKESIAKRPVVIEYHNCWLSKIGSQEFSYENEEETITRTATFTYDYFKVKGSGETQINDTCAGDV